MSDEPKDFRYYADKAEKQLQLSLGRDEGDQPLYIDADMKTRHVMRAQVYATLATAAPKVDAEPQYIVLTPEQEKDYEAMKGGK